MNNQIAAATTPTIVGPHSPSISLFLPFNPKMCNKKELEQKLQNLLEEVRTDIANKYPESDTGPVMKRLERIIHHLDYGSFKQSVAIFVSAEIEKVYYIDLPLEEKVIVDGAFEIRDLVYSKKDPHKYLVLVISSSHSHIYLGNTISFMRIAFNTPEHAAAYKTDLPSRVGNFTDTAQRKELMVDKFLHHIDNGLGLILNAYPLPLFIMGPEKVMGHFKSISKHIPHVLHYIHGNFDDCSEKEIRKILESYVCDWKKVRQEEILHRLDAATGAKKIVTGISNVFRDADHKRGRLLVIEKNYTFFRTGHTHTHEGHPAHHIKDMVDETIEKVLQNGGDIEFVDPGLLEDYDHIALTLYY